jgi:nucleotide-binding universal stress UspA family protein
MTMSDKTATIVVGIDFSSEAQEAARQALGVARHLGAELVLVHVRATVELPVVPDRRDSADRALQERWREHDARELAAAREELGRLRERLSGQGVPVSQLLVEDYPADGLCAAASQLGARFTVVGTHGRTGLRWLQMGSVAQHVVRQSETDVLVARRSSNDAYHRILVATDFSASAERALDSAIALAAPGARIDVVHHVPTRWRAGGNVAAGELLSRDIDLLADFTREQGVDLLARKQVPGFELLFHVSTERPVPGIVHWLETHGGDLVVLGSHGRRGVRRFLLGSVAEAVVRHAPCSVLVAHGAPGVERAA